MSKPRMGAPKRVAVGLLAGSLAMFGVAFAPSAGATAAVTTSRLQGASRWATAKAIATDASLTGGTVAIVASGEDSHLADALAASGLAGANGPAPIVLTQTATYTQDAKDALAALKAKGVTTVFVVGGTLAVTDTVLNAIKADGFTTTRVADVDRFSTAAAIGTQAKAKKAIGTTGTLPTAIIANGLTGLPDALAAGSASYAQNFPILLVNADTVPAATSKAITDLGIKKVIITGGTAVVSAAVQTSLETATGNPATRIGGTDRNDTAALIGDYAIGTLGFAATTAVLANGISLIDALAAGPYAGQNKAPIVLTGPAPLATQAQAFLDKYSSRISKIVVAGGTSAVSDAAVTSAQTAAQTTGNDTLFTDAPELQSVGLKSVDLTTGTLVLKATFSKDIIAAPVIAGSFKLWTAYGEATTATAAQRDATDTKTALVSFQPGTSVPSYFEATVFTVASGAVQDTAGHLNPEGEQPGLTTQAFAGNSTRVPDLVSATVVDATHIDYLFDEAVTAGTAGSFQAMPATGGAVRPGTATALQADTKTVRVTFGDTSLLGRAAVVPNAVTSATTTLTNPTEVVSLGSGSTDRPDLVSVTLDPATDTASFTFDENIDTFTTQGVATGFHLFYRNVLTGAVANSDVGFTERSATDLRTVVAKFPAGAVNKEVAGAYVQAGAVFRPGGTISNLLDEKGVAQSFAPGAFLGPQLTSVTRSTTNDSFGAALGNRLEYKFDQKVVQTGSPSFVVYDAAGVRQVLTAGNCTTRATPNNDTVRCDFQNDLTSASSKAIASARLATVASGSVNTITNVVVTTAGAPTTATNHEERTGIS